MKKGSKEKLFRRKKPFGQAWFCGHLLVLGLISSAAAQNNSSLHLQFFGLTLASSEVTVWLEAPFLASPLVGCPDSTGHLVWLGLSPGNYNLILRLANKREWKEEIELEPAQFLQVEFKFSESTRPPLVEKYDLADIGAQTVVNSFQLSLLPAADNLWSIIENQDLSATTNRIDSGGLWVDSPALFSARGATSWTQNEFRLNGFNVTEPYFGGTPLFLPDLKAVEAIRHRNSLHPASATSPGGIIEIATKKGTSRFQGGTSYALIEPKLTTSNITPALEKEGLTDVHDFNHDRKLRLWLSGPLASENRRFYLSFYSQDLSRHIADYPGHNQSRLLSGLIRLDQATSWGELSFFWTGQQVRETEAGARRKMTPEATTSAKRNFHVAQLFWQSLPSSRLSFHSGLSLAYQKILSDPYVSPSATPCRELFRPVVWQAPLRYGEETRGHLNFQVNGNWLINFPSNSIHLASFGLEISRRFYSSELQIPGSTHLLFLEGQPAQVAFFAPASKELDNSLDISLYIEDSWQISRYFIFDVGAKVILTRGWSQPPSQKRSWGGLESASGSRVDWLSFLPRASLTVPFGGGKKGSLKFFFGQSAFFLPLNYLRWGNAAAEGALIYSWFDRNLNNQFDEGELGPLLRREGPFFSRLDSDLRRPVTTDYAVSFIYRLSREFYLSLSGFRRITRNLVETENIGVPESAFETFRLDDSGDDRIWGTHDDLSFIIYNRLPSALGRDFFELSNPHSAERTSRYRGLDLTVLRRFSQHIFFFSFTATEAFGTTSPGNTEWENDEAIIGWLYDDPNSLLNARGRLRFDRAYTARLGFSLFLPADFRAGFVFKYYDGQPFSRKIIVTSLRQGPVVIQAFPRGIARYEFNLTVDFRLEKSWVFLGAKNSLFIEGYNIFNQHLATEENEWTTPQFPLRFATEIQSPRVFRLGLKIEF